MSLTPATDAGAFELANPGMQGSRVRIWIGALNLGDPNRAVMGDPFLLFDGELDQPKLWADKNKRQLDYDLVSSFERLFTDDEGLRLSPASHKEFWPGETGLDEITGVARQVLWGPGDPITSSGPGTSYGSPSVGGVAREAVRYRQAN
jgi:hypothetical protein